MNDIDVKANRSWKYEDLNCMACNEPNRSETQQHVLVCVPLMEKNSKVTYNELYSENIEEQVYTSVIL